MGRFLYALGTGIERVADDHARKIIEANREIGQELKETLETGFEGVQEGQARIHEALVDQTQVIARGFEAVEISLEGGFNRVVGRLDSTIESIDRNSEVVAESGLRITQGLAELRAAFDMGMADVVTQFELQRRELRRGFDLLADILENNRKTEARERFLDGRQHFEYYLAHPAEPQFLTDAYEYLQESVRIYRGNPFAHLYLGHIHQEAAHYYDPGQAFEHYSRCATYAKGISNDKLAALGYFLAAWMQYVLRQPAEAVQLALQSLRYDDSLPENYYNLAKYYAVQQEAEPALRYLDLAVRQFDPRYTLKASIDPDFTQLGSALDDYFGRIRDEAALRWRQRLQLYLE
ncbi:MAG: hypothetical protein OHK0039_41640 [Bacteroidia bacterium]